MKEMLDNLRSRTPCFFEDGLSFDEFNNIVQKAKAKTDRLLDVRVDGANIRCTYESQSGRNRYWFNLNFNDWGHITGVCWQSDNNYTNSNLPDYFSNMVQAEVKALLAKKHINLISFSDIIDEDPDVGAFFSIKQKKGTHKNKLFHSKRGQILAECDADDLTGEHLCPVIAILHSNGFYNIKTLQKNDVDGNSNHFFYEVEDIIIDGNRAYKEGDIFSSNAEVVIVYHYKREIAIPISKWNFKWQPFDKVSTELKQMGFSNISGKPLKDLRLDIFEREGTVDKIVVNQGENKSLKPNVKYPFDIPILIHYHSQGRIGKWLSK